MVRLGILGCSEIAYRRFMPTTANIKELQVVAIAEEYDKAKLEPFCQKYNLEEAVNFEDLLQRQDIDAVYVPQPPSLHYEWTKKALLYGKHVLVEKPFTIRHTLSKELIEIAKAKKLVLHENYMFQYHSQIKEIKKILADGVIGDVRLIRADFGFPMRARNDFRYDKELGGGSLFDAGGYTARLAAIMLGDTIKVDAAHLQYLSGFEVDMYGNASFSNAEGMVCQVGYGMDCFYRCTLEVWGSKGQLSTSRIFTAPEDFYPSVIINTAKGVREFCLKKDSHFQHSIELFLMEIEDVALRKKMYREILLQAKLVEDIKTLAEN